MHILPIRSNSPETNMALDMLILESYPQPDVPRFRHYGWSQPSWTFGYSQKWSIKHDLIIDMAAHIVRRPTGGGLVDHFHDWTYSLVIAPSHDLFAEKAVISYKVVHQALADALQANGCSAMLMQSDNPAKEAVNSSILDTPPPSDICFEHPEIFDVIHENGAKIAGAAQKRSRHGLLFQGSINRQAVGDMSWDNFLATFTRNLATALGTQEQDVDFPELDPEQVNQLSDEFKSDSWNRQR